MMQPLTFYYASGSPFAWKVWLALEHKGIAYTLRRLSFDAGDLETPEYTAVNPRRRVPAIVDEGFALYESAAIIDYLDDKYAASGASLWPRETQARALARRVAAEVDAYVFPPIRTLVEEMLSGSDAAPGASRIAETKELLAAELALVTLSIAGTFIAGASASAADFALYPAMAFLGRIDDRRPGYDMRLLIPARMQAWMEAVEALPYFAKTYPPHWRT